MFFNFLVSPKKITPSPSYVAQGGFGLIELMVSVTIMVIVAGIVITNQGSFNNTVLLHGQAYEIALQIRDVQQSAVSANFDGGEYRSIMGVHFNLSNKQSYTVFRDLATGGVGHNIFYDVGEEFGVQGFIDPRFEIKKITYTDTGVVHELNEISIVFIRPNFDPYFVKEEGGLSNIVETNSVFIDIGLVGEAGVFKTIEVTATGQIAVQ